LVKIQKAAAVAEEISATITKNEVKKAYELIEIFVLLRFE
jgi:hypothetical protein